MALEFHVAPRATGELICRVQLIHKEHRYLRKLHCLAARNNSLAPDLFKRVVTLDCDNDPF